MFSYSTQDLQLVHERAQQFKDQVKRRLNGDITEAEFKPLRLQNGLYMQLHSYMLRVNVPYGRLSDSQMRTLADVADQYDRGYGHFTTRQNIQYNWVDLEDVPALLEKLADAEMHAIQSSGNCIRNVTSDAFAGHAKDESTDPRPFCEIIRQWSTFHPEFAFLPRKFKIAVIASDEDRAAMRFHDIGLRVKRTPLGETVHEIWAGGGQGRTPVVSKLIFDDVPTRDLLIHLESMLRVYNQYGRRDNKYKARIKILINALGPDAYRDEVVKDMSRHADPRLALQASDMHSIVESFRTSLPAPPTDSRVQSIHDPHYDAWRRQNCVDHRSPQHTIVVLPLKNHGLPPGDATSAMMRTMADLASTYSGGRLVVSHRQNIVLPAVPSVQLYPLWKALKIAKLAAPIFDSAADVICCPGLDYCALANARSIGISQEIQARVAPLVEGLSERLHINVSGCINACGHHHVGNIGILGVNKLGDEYYQISVGGDAVDDAAIGQFVGRALPPDRAIAAVEEIVSTYTTQKLPDETFNETLARIGLDPFKEAAYAD